MPTNEEVQMILKLRDEATAEWRRASEDFKRTTKGMSDAVVDATGKLRSHKGEVSDLSKWVREQAREQREQNFLFRQSKEVVGASSSVLALFSNTAGRTNKEMRMLSDSMNDGFTTFQGVGNVLTFLPGPIGMVTAGIAGLAVVFDRVNSAASVNFDNLNKLDDQLTEVMIKLGELPKTIKFSLLSADIILAEAELRRLKGTTTDIGSTFAAWWFFGARGGVVKKVIGSPEEIKAVELALKQAQLRMKEFTDEFTKEEKPAEGKKKKTVVEKVPDEVIEAYHRLIPLVQSYDNSIQMATISTSQLKDVSIEVGQVFDNNWRTGMEVATNGFVTFYDTLLTSHQNLRSATNSLTDAIVNQIKRIAAEFAANLTIFTLMKSFGLLGGETDFGAFMGSKEGKSSWQADVFSTLFKLVFHQGGRVPKAHDGAFIDAPPSREFPILVRGGETVRTERQEMDVQRKLNGGSNSGSGNMFVFNFSAPTNFETAVTSAIKRAVEKTGMSVDKLTVNQRSANEVTLAS